MLGRDLAFFFESKNVVLVYCSLLFCFLWCVWVCIGWIVFLVVYFGITIGYSIGFIYGLCLNRLNFFLLTNTMYIPTCLNILNKQPWCMPPTSRFFFPFTEKKQIQPVYKNFKRLHEFLYRWLGYVDLFTPTYHSWMDGKVSPSYFTNHLACNHLILWSCK